MAKKLKRLYECKSITIDKLLTSFVLFKFIGINTYLQLIMCVFPMEVCLQLSAHGYNIDPAKPGG